MLLAFIFVCEEAEKGEAQTPTGDLNTGVEVWNAQFWVGFSC